jgi:hypothetical protein
MWIQVPEDIEQVLWEGPLAPAADEAVEQAERELTERRFRADTRTILRDLPVVRIGQPETWPLQALYPRDKMPLSLQAKLNEADFYLVALACSFRPVHGESRIQWARFRAYLVPDSAGHQPLAYDLYPNDVVQEVKRQVKVTLNPTLTFHEVGASVGSVEFGWVYPELQPLISGTGQGQPDAMWDYEEAKGIRIQGGKWMYLLVKAPKGMPSGRVILDLAADVVVAGSILPTRILPNKQEATEQLAVPLWG